MKHEASLLCPCGPHFDLDGLHHREPPGPAVTRDELARIFEPDAFPRVTAWNVDYQQDNDEKQRIAYQHADRLILARFAVHHPPERRTHG